jgi:hypothetical protein
MSHLPKVRRSNSASQFTMSKGILPHFYKPLTSVTYAAGKNLPQLWLQTKHMPNLRYGKLLQVRQRTKQIHSIIAPD